MEIERKNLIFRRISYLDFHEFKKAGIESIGHCRDRTIGKTDGVVRLTSYNYEYNYETNMN
jgi:hypothetical protein